MKYIVIKIYELNKKYSVKVQYLKYTEQKRIIENEYINELANIDNLKYFISNISINSEYKKANLIINYLSNSIIIENISINNQKFQGIKGKELLNSLFPNYENNYLCQFQNYNLYNKRKYLLVRMIKKNNDLEIKNLMDLINYKKKIFNYDQQYLDNYLSHHRFKLLYKHLFFIQVENNYWRFSEILNGKLVNYLILSDKDPNFEKERNFLFRQVDRRIDEIIIDSDYRTFNTFAEEWSMYNIIYIDYAEKFRFIDEKKYVCALK